MATTMQRLGVNKSGGGFDNATIEAVWRKATVMSGCDEKSMRRDAWTCPVSVDSL